MVMYLNNQEKKKTVPEILALLPMLDKISKKYFITRTGLYLNRNDALRHLKSEEAVDKDIQDLKKYKYEVAFSLLWCQWWKPLYLPISFKEVATKAYANKAVFSYGLKHRIEEDCGNYIANGSAIAAALILNIPFKYSSRSGPNIYIALDQKAIYKRTDSIYYDSFCKDIREQCATIKKELQDLNQFNHIANLPYDHLESRYSVI